ncbi:hypothetical protein Pmar_PMAR027523 [Perkinsus marinus ATCC 50983]|uniref:Uncharacterized protein n=1 Tax=Perkinsus marinus (strain ATCC 50983 / TXsc) TaxID=423536 RepID=C5LPD2_PERM5|nr:hypothetical protein Pmar_PMAR027523 [Perkinsus marinus ATCC 50983]EER01394.1 hypothetical protein Pmar_PMAR027523 [Perkinsus marinus ATCC 50983]|eukprot:XP_002768676.1 hypothetical protein Pmar_PMAR027523 [Perkinsus marinus ATCC 50983]
MLCGYIGKDFDWDESFDIDPKNPPYKVLCSCISVVEDYVEQGCHHPVKHPDQLKVYVDASATGWAWYWRSVEDSVSSGCI